MSGITIFNHLGNDIRVMTDEQGEPWFVLKDICAALEIENTSRVAGRLEEDDLTTSKVTDNLGRNQLSFLISEVGLYEVIFDPQAWTPGLKGYLFSAYPFYSPTKHLRTPRLRVGGVKRPSMCK